MKFFFIPTSLVELHRDFIDAFTMGDDPNAFDWATRAIGKNKDTTAEMLLFSGKDSKDFAFNAVIYRVKNADDVSIIGFSAGVDEDEIFSKHTTDHGISKANEDQFNAMKNKALNVMMDI